MLPALPGIDAGARAVAAGERASRSTPTTHVDGQHVRVCTHAVAARPAARSRSATPLTNVDHELVEDPALAAARRARRHRASRRVAGFLVARAALKPVRDLSETAERVRDDARPLAADRGRRAATSSSRLAATFNAMLESLDEAAAAPAPARPGRLARAADAAHEPAHEHRGARAGRRAAAGRARSSCSRDVVAQLGEMTDADRGADRARARRGAADRARGGPARPRSTEDAIRRTARNHPDVPIERRARADDASSATPASLERAIANLLDNAAKWSPPGGAGRGARSRRRADGARPRPRASPRPTCRTSSSASTARRRRASMPGSGLGLAIVQPGRRGARRHGRRRGRRPAAAR